MNKKIKTFLLFLISIGILGGIIWFSNPLSVLNVLAKTNLNLFALGIGLWSITFLLRAKRWDLLLKNVKIKLPFKDVLSIYSIGKVISNITPSRAGDPIKAYIIKKKFRKPFSLGLGSVVMEKITDAFAIFGILIIGGFLPGSPIPQKWHIASIIFLTALLILILKLTMTKKNHHKTSEVLISIFSFSKKIRNHKTKMNNSVDKFINSFKKYNKKTLIITTLMSGAIWLLDGVVLWLSFKAVGIDINLLLPILAVPVIMIVGILSLLPGSIGSSELTSVVFFVTFAGIAAPEATAATLLSRLIMWWMYMVVGVIVMSTNYRLNIMLKWIKFSKIMGK